MKIRKPVNEEEWLYRRGYCTPVKKYMNPDGTATSRVFKLRERDDGELSVDVKSITTPEKSIGDNQKYFLFEIHNKFVLEIGLLSFHEPMPDNEAHSVIVGMTLDDEILPGSLARNSKRVYV